MVIDFYSKKIKVFVSEVPPEMQDYKDHLIKVLDRAGMEALYVDPGFLPNSDQLGSEIERLIHLADCSVHLVGHRVSDFRSINHTPIIEFQLNLAQQKLSLQWHEFKVFIWEPFETPNGSQELPNPFLNSLRQKIVQNMLYSNKDNAISFVEDIRSVMYGGKPVEYEISKTDLFFIYNQIDQENAEEVIGMLLDVIKIKELEIVLSAEVDYSELVSQQIAQSRVAVIYFSKAWDWALPFVQQIWKKTGGASSPAPILFIGDANIESNIPIRFDAPKVTSIVVPNEIMPIEIKVQYDKLTA
jgi:hypothetical protein